MWPWTLPPGVLNAGCLVFGFLLGVTWMFLVGGYCEDWLKERSRKRREFRVDTQDKES